VRLPVDIIFSAYGTPAALASRKATSSIPIVFAGVGDAVGVGLVASLARPGGNATGSTVIGEETIRANSSNFSSKSFHESRGWERW
jgi:putative ABC transport system substrate-binding protein